MSGRLLSVEGLSSGYGDIRVLHNVDLYVAPGEIVALLGPNGAGKSTFIASVVNATRRFAGTVMLDGEDVSRVPTSKFASMGVAVGPQGIGVFGEMTVAENIAVARTAAGRDRDGETEEEIVQLFPILRERWRQRAGNLSGGQRQMLGVARALSARPRLLLLDEPSLGLAPKAVAALLHSMAEARERLDLSVVLAEQDVGAASAACTRFYLLKVGRVAAEGKIGADFRERVAAEYLV